MILAWLGLAAAAPAVTASLAGGFGHSADEAPPGLGAGFALALPAHPAWQAELSGRLLASPALSGGLGLGARFTPQGPLGASWTASVGAWREAQGPSVGRLQPALTAGPAWSVALGDDAALVAQALVVVGPEARRAVFELGVRVGGRPEVAPQPMPEVSDPTLAAADPAPAEPAVEEPGESAPIEAIPTEPVAPAESPTDAALAALRALPDASDLPAAERVTVAWPECRTVPLADAPAVLRAAAQPVRVRVGDGPEAVLAPGGDLAAPPAQGSLLVASGLGDEVRVGGQRVPTGRDGLATLSLPEGAWTVEIAGGGRAITEEIAISAGHATWLRVRAQPATLTVRFPVNRDQLDAAGQGEVDLLGSRAGAWTLVVRGGYSPEGSLEANIALAQARAEAVAARLRAAGVPAAQVVVVPPEPPDPALSPADQRMTFVSPRPPEAP